MTKRSRLAIPLTYALFIGTPAFAVDLQLGHESNIATESPDIWTYTIDTSLSIATVKTTNNGSNIQLAQASDAVAASNSESLPAFVFSSTMIARSRGEFHDGSEFLKIDRPEKLEHPGTEVTSVYFELNEDEVDTNGRVGIQAVGQHILQLFQSSNLIPEVYVEGHADRTGGWKFNYDLAHDRALSVRETLASAGVPLDWIHVSDHSEDQLSVPTADGIEEPRNRRVEITVVPGARCSGCS